MVMNDAAPPLLSIEAALARVLGALSVVPSEIVGLAEAAGRVLAAPVAARLTQPPADVSAMDGYALRAADAGVGARLRVVGAAPAGRPFDGTLKWGEAVRLFTGSVIPAGADSVLLQEDADAEAETVVVREAPRVGQHIRRQGQDFAAGDLVLPAGRRLTARDVGLAAAANHPWLTVYRRPRVAILSTGDEISMPGEPIGPGGIVSSNAHSLAAMVRAAGGEAVVLPVAGDSVAAIAAAAARAAGMDLLVTTGGASVGDHDLVQAGLAQAGAGGGGFTLEFWKIAMRPGKPMIFGRLGGLPVLGLPGNPVSAFVCGVLFLLPALARLSGRPDTTLPVDSAVLGRSVRANDHRADHLRATLSRDPGGKLVATPFERQDSAMVRAMAAADVLVVRPPGAPALPVGAWVPVIRLDMLGL
jgi:molybdopterin molybdotransferase